MRRKLAAGNWKMNGMRAELAVLDELAAGLPAGLNTEVLICPPATLLPVAVAVDRTETLVYGGQDCHAATSGAHTGDVSAPMLAETGARYVIVGHSERRADHHETDADVQAKAKAAYAAGLTAIICIGESEAERDAGTTLDILAAQLEGSCPPDATGENTVIAYEPIWAIGTGRVPEVAQIAEVHAHLRARLAEHMGTDAAGAIRLLYGGSVKPSNAAEIFAVPEVDGALVGGASLKASDFLPIVTALDAA